MLDSSSLKSDIEAALTDTLPSAIELGVLSTFKYQTKEAKEDCKLLGETVTELVAGPLAERLAAAIDAYVKCIDITGTIITAGTPVTQTAVIMTTTIPTLNGKIPNTLGIM